MPIYFPAFLDVRDKRSVVVGGGDVAERKAQALVDCGASVTVISPVLSYGLERMAERGLILWKERSYQPGDLKGVFIAVAATDDPRVNEAVSRDAKAQGTLVNVVDVPNLGNFIFPAVARQGELTLAVSTSGLSPALARRVRQDLEESFIPPYAQLLPLLAEVRRELRSNGKRVSPETWQGCINSEVIGLLKEGDYQGAKKKVLALLRAAEGGQ